MMLGTEDVAKLSDKQLFEELKKNNLNPGPITGSTRSVYEKKLIKFLNEAKKVNVSRRGKTPTRASTTTTPSQSSPAVSRSIRYHDKEDEEDLVALVPELHPTVTTTERIVKKTTITKQLPRTSAQAEITKSIPKPKLEFKLLKDTRTPEVHRGVADGDDDDEPIVLEERWSQPMEINNSKNARSHPYTSSRSVETDYDCQTSRPFSTNYNMPSRSFMATPNLFRTPHQPQSGEYPLNSTVLTYSGSNRESIGGMASASKPKAEPLKNLIKIKPSKLFAESPIESNYNRHYKRIYPDLNADSNHYERRSNENSLYNEPAPPIPSHLQPKKFTNENRLSFLNYLKSDVFKYVIIGVGFFILLWFINSWLTQNDEDPIL
jgi:hypothetical protein